MGRTDLRPEELQASLQRSSGASVELRETHISWVFLTAERAYKLKKPVTLPFLDYGTPSKRRRMCAEEVRLNRRLAPAIYVGVRAVVRTGKTVVLDDEGQAGAVDYVVEMERYDEQRTIAGVLDRGELRAADVAAAGRMLAAFHGRAKPARGPAFGAWRAQQLLDRNLEELLGVAASPSEREQVHALARFLNAFVGARTGLLDERAAAGLVREGHGDLRAEHVVLGDPVQVVDCAEFDRDMRTLDVADDLAFLVMDLAALGGERFVAPLVQAYRGAGGECGPDSLLAFFAVHRALIRAKVLLVRSAQHPPSSPERARSHARARELIELARRFSWRARLPLAIVVCGVPASGKSRLAAAVAHESRLPVLNSDPLRKSLAGIAPTGRAPAENYTDEFSRATYAELGRRAADEVAKRGGVVIDATFRRLPDRQAFAHEFRAAAPLLFVECIAPADVLAQRAALRDRDPERVSDATTNVVLRERARWQPLDELPPRSHLLLRTDQPPPAILGDLLALLDQRLEQDGG